MPVGFGTRTYQHGSYFSFRDAGLVSERSTGVCTIQYWRHAVNRCWGQMWTDFGTARGLSLITCYPMYIIHSHGPMQPMQPMQPSCPMRPFAPSAPCVGAPCQARRDGGGGGGSLAHARGYCIAVRCELSNSFVIYDCCRDP